MSRQAMTFAPHMTSPSSGYRPEIDGLRAVAVAAVIAHHFSASLLPGGFLGVDMFFVISGYVITASLARSPQASFMSVLASFYARRVKRLVPALAVCVTLTCLLGSLVIDPHASEYARSMKAAVFALFGLSNVFFYGEATDYFGAAASLNLFTHTWSLGVEEQFYLVFPALLWMSGVAFRRPGAETRLSAILGHLTLVSFALYALLFVWKPAAAYFMMPARFWELSIGCMLALGAPREPRAGSPAAWIAGLVLAAAMLAPVEARLVTTPAAVLSTAVLIGSVHRGHALYTLLTRPPVLTIGLMSYSLYLWHWSVLSLSRWTVGVSLETAPFQFAAMLGLAAASYHYVERPLRRASWSPSRRKTIGYGLAAATASAALVLIVKSGLDGALYTGTPVEMAAKGIDTLTEDKWAKGRVHWRPRNCVLAANGDAGKRIDAEHCMLKPQLPSAEREFLVIGNSFVAAELEMLSALRDAGLGNVVATASWAASPVREVPNASPWSAANRYYWDSVVPALTARMRPGDVLIMINDMAPLVPERPAPATAHSLVRLAEGLDKLARDMREKGVSIVFQSQNPLLRDALCTPDMARPQWFNLGHDLCRYHTRQSTLARLAPLRRTLEDIRSRNPNFHILDLMPVLCPGEVCGFFDARGTPLYRDVWSYPSVEANRLSRPLLLSAVSAALSAAVSDARGDATTTRERTALRGPSRE